MKAARRRRGGRGGRGRGGRAALAAAKQQSSFWGWLKSVFSGASSVRAARPSPSIGEQEARAIAEFCRHYKLEFRDPELLKLALTHRSYLSVTGLGPRESNERLEFLGDSVLGLVTSEFLYLEHPHEHEGQLTKTKSLLVSKAILSRRALEMGLGRFVLMSHSEVESGGRQRLSILADAFESVLGAIYLDLGFEASRAFIMKHLLREAREISADKRHTNYKSHLQEYVQSNFRTHPVYRIRSEVGPDHSKQFVVEVMVGKRGLGEGKGHNKKEAEQEAARDALERANAMPGEVRRGRSEDLDDEDAPAPESRGRERRGRGRAERTERSERPERSERTERFEPVERVERVERPARAAVAPPRQDVVEDDVELDDVPIRRGRPAASEPVESRRPEPASFSRSVPTSVPPSRPVPKRATVVGTTESIRAESEPLPRAFDEDDMEEIGRPDGPLEDRHVDVYAFDPDDPTPEVELAPLPSPEFEPGRRAREPRGRAVEEEDDEAPAEAEAPIRSWASRSADRDDPEPEVSEPAPPRTSAPPPRPSFGRRRRPGR